MTRSRSLRERAGALEVLRPPVGRRRELWDTSVFLFLIGLVGYVATTPPPTTAAVLAAPLQVVTETQLGWVLTAATGVGIIASYIDDEKATEVGYRFSRTASWFMALNFFVGLVLILLDGQNIGSFVFDVVIPDLTPAQEEQAFRFAFLYTLIFGWATRRLSRDNRAWWEC